MEAVGTARLTNEIPAQHAVAATVSSSQIRDVLGAADTVPELVLDVVVGDGGHDTISMTWSRDDLERLLRDATADEVVLTFDSGELAGALGDVEAHGLRTRAAVFAVAAAGALGGGATAAHATLVAGDGGGGATRAPAAAAVATPDAAAALQARSQAMNEQYGLGTSGAGAALQARSEGMNEEYGLGGAAGGQTDPASRALADRGAAMNTEYGLGAAAADARVTDASSAGGYGPAPTAATDSRVTDASSAGGYGPAPTAATDSRVTDASSAGGYGPAPTASSGGFDFRQRDVDDALIGGAVLLAIAGATFAARRTTTPRPA